MKNLSEYIAEGLLDSKPSTENKSKKDNIVHSVVKDIEESEKENE